MWIRWVDDFYLKGKDTDVIVPSCSCSWLWKSILLARDEIKSRLSNMGVDPNQYNSVKELYNKLIHAPTVQWRNIAWHGSIFPRHPKVTTRCAKKLLFIEELRDPDEGDDHKDVRDSECGALCVIGDDDHAEAVSDNGDGEGDVPSWVEDGTSEE
ncbi:hypothetical protein Droror1_Dr00021784 [Drosera rotundifolia]